MEGKPFSRKSKSGSKSGSFFWFASNSDLEIGVRRSREGPKIAFKSELESVGRHRVSKMWISGDMGMSSGAPGMSDGAMGMSDGAMGGYESLVCPQVPWRANLEQTLESWNWG